MLHLFLFGVFCIARILGQVSNVVIPRGQPFEFSNPTYPGDLGWKETTLVWNFEVEPDAKIKIVCDDLRMMQMPPWTEDCQYVHFSVTDGYGERRVCGDTVSNFVHKSDGPKLTAKIISKKNGSGLFKCFAYNTGDLKDKEIIKLLQNGRVKKIEVGKDGPLPNLDRLWEFESSPGTRISLQCYLSFQTMKPMCGKNVFIFNNGEYDEEYCEGKSFKWFSKINKAKIRVQFDQVGQSSASCLVQAVTGPNPNEFENIVSVEVDSSEHGVTPGARKTSCKCGMANKRNARVLDGVESKVNEFPWMVYLDILHKYGDSASISSCGASIITERHVLTAAHCVVSGGIVVSPENVEMTLARHDVEKPTGKEKTISAEKIFVKDLFLQKGLDYHDIALILTKETIDFSTPFIGPICIEPTEYDVINRRILIMGWGLTENYVASNYLRKSKARVMDPIICGGRAWDVCTMTTPSATCNGDSGGPLVWLDPESNRYSQISLVSRGSLNNCRGLATKSTLVAYFYDWIQDIIKATVPSVSTCHKV